MYLIGILFSTIIALAFFAIVSSGLGQHNDAE